MGDLFLPKNLLTELAYHFSCSSHRMPSEDAAVAIRVSPEEIVKSAKQVPQWVFIKLALRTPHIIFTHLLQLVNLDMWRAREKRLSPSYVPFVVSPVSAYPPSSNHAHHLICRFMRPFAPEGTKSQNICLRT